MKQGEKQRLIGVSCTLPSPAFLVEKVDGWSGDSVDACNGATPVSARRSA
jgi:hypothetical protein